MHEEQERKEEEEEEEERRLASPNNHCDIRRVEPGSRGAVAEPASCSEAACLTSLDLIGQLSAGVGEGGGTSQNMQINLGLFLLLVFFFVFFKLVYMDRFSVFQHSV